MLALIAVAGCGTPTAAVPTASDVLGKPQHSNLKDAHFVLSGLVTVNNARTTLSGDGALMYQPKPAGKITFHTSVAGQTATIEQISIDGTNYGRGPGAPKWVAIKSSSPLDPSAFNGASDQKYIGEETLPAGKAWHATARDRNGNAFDAYIRESDGYPIKYVVDQGAGQNITLTFDRYNTGAAVSPPAPTDVQSG